jgi:hypothetical protein
MPSTYEVKSFRQTGGSLLHQISELAHQNFRSSFSRVSTLLLGTPSPLFIEALAIIERFLRPHPCGRESGIQIGASHRL